MSEERVLEDYLAGDLNGRLPTYIEAVQTGTKPVASCGLLKFQVPSAVELVGREGLHFLILPWTEDRVILYLFRNLYLADIVVVLDALSVIRGKVFPTWLWGKLYGYNDRDISRYVEEAGLVRPPPPVDSKSPTSTS